MLTHQSGIPNYTDNPEYLAKTMVKEYTLQQLAELLCSDFLEFVPRTSFHYSNSGYVILALVIEKITGRKYADVLTSKIISPLNMKSSFFGSHSPLSINVATGYVNDHPGTEPGFYTMIVRQPDDGIVIILLSNKGEFPRFAITDLILKVLNQ